MLPSSLERLAYNHTSGISSSSPPLPRCRPRRGLLPLHLSPPRIGAHQKAALTKLGGSKLLEASLLRVLQSDGRWDSGRGAGRRALGTASALLLASLKELCELAGIQGAHECMWPETTSV